MTGLKTVTPEERLLETMRYVLQVASECKTLRAGMTDIVFAVHLAISDYEAAQRIERTPNSTVIRGEIQSKGGR